MFHWYGFLIGVGVIVSAKASSWLAKRRGIPEKIVWDGLWWAFLGGLIGARIYHVADLWGEVYSLNPISALYVWNGGLGIIGGIIGGVFGVVLYFKFQISNFKFNVSFKQFLDLAFFGLPIGQIIGRIGNFINQEVYGWPTKLPWGIYVRPENRLAEFREFNRFHPLFAYEIMWMLLGFGLMLMAEKTNKLRWIKRSYTGFYLVWYGIGRFFLDFLRPEDFVWRLSSIPFGPNMAQVFSLGMILTGIVIICYRKHSFD